jgi:DNA-binding transcriptional MocR family regulator
MTRERATLTTEDWLSRPLESGAKYQAIADSLEAAVADGRLRGGDRLPPQRDLAQRLGVDLTTVTKAYDVARQRGLIEARGRLGSFVREPENTGFAQLPQVDTGMNMPPALPEGALSRAIADGTTALLRSGSGARLQYQPPGGALQDRIAGAALLSETCTATVAEQVVLTAGGQNALHAILASTLAPGDGVACGRHVYSGLKALATRRSLRLVPLPEMNAAALAAALAADRRIRAVYLVPTNDNPTALTLDIGTRRAIAEVVAQHNVQLIEDDAYALLAAERLPTVTSFAPERCWYIASTSKIITPALRIAFVRAPDVAAALTLASDVHETAIMAPPISAALVSGWIASGAFHGLVTEMRAEVTARRALAEEALAGLAWRGHPQGYHLWIPVPEGMTGHAVAEAMRATELPVVPAARFALDDAPDDAVRVSLGGLSGHDRIASALRTLRGHLLSPRRHGAMMV